MTAQEIIDYLRQDLLRDYAKPYLWTDDLLLLYLNRAYLRFCRETYVALDNQSFVIPLLVGTYMYELDERVLQVKSARLTGATHNLTPSSFERLPAPDTAVTGTPEFFTTDDEANYVRFYPTPDTATDVTLRCVATYPELEIEDSPLVPKRYHLELSHGVAELCFRQNDADEYMKEKAEDQKTLFEAFLSRAKHDVYRLRAGPNPTVRPNWTGKR